ncbi:hypothetical protein SLOPH_687 [Spraguea lophii 42_110]|uniref:Profilin n=1 Tax=Spraguea lophii (strain 42_110) TaxID=1358809 RepID=S7XUX6_SPRLO|nr:hypothetical protein SLOPH_687 [Spraguea lophii 42_110]
MADEVEEYTAQWKEYFDDIVETNKNDLLSLELIDIEGFHFTHNTCELDDDVLCQIVELLNQQTEKIDGFQYSDEKFVFLRKFTSEQESEIYLFLSTGSEEKKALCIGLAFGSFVVIGKCVKDNMQQLVRIIMEETDKRV